MSSPCDIWSLPLPPLLHSAGRGGLLDLTLGMVSCPRGSGNSFTVCAFQTPIKPDNADRDYTIQRPRPRERRQRSRWQDSPVSPTPFLNPNGPTHLRTGNASPAQSRSPPAGTGTHPAAVSSALAQGLSPQTSPPGTEQEHRVRRFCVVATCAWPARSAPLTLAK